MSSSIALPPRRLCIGLTGHRDGNVALTANRADIEAAIASAFDLIDAVVARQADAIATTRLHALLASGADLMAVEIALARGWSVSAQLPFGHDLNVAINSHAVEAQDALALISGRVACNSEVAARARNMRDTAARVRRFELAEQDERVSRLYVDMLRAPEDARAAQAYALISSDRAALAGRVMIEQSDALIAIWDGASPGAAGGTRHTLAAALEHGAPVVWIDASAPERWTLLRTPEQLAMIGSNLPTLARADFERLITELLNPPGSDQKERAIRFQTEQWHPRSNRWFHSYRRVEALFGGGGAASAFAGLLETYETPDGIARGSGAPLLEAARALPGGDPAFVAQIEAQVLRRFAWADGLSTYLSDAYRGGMVANFLLSACAIIAGVAYLPLAGATTKWPFALIELVLLCSILAITAIGTRHRWHGRWFETRRVAEYFRHASALLLLGVARSRGRWPRGSDTEWPEHYARLALRELGLPHIAVTQAYLRAALTVLLLSHAERQRSYHRSKARRLRSVHRRLGRLSEAFFALAVLAVAAYLLLVAAAAVAILPPSSADAASEVATFMGVAFPALGGAIAGIRYFGDFERFAAISEVTAEKLCVIEQRIQTLLAAPQGGLLFAQVADLAHAIDDTVVAEIENWQAVFGGKQVAVPV
jgi:hypothetical protein